MSMEIASADVVRLIQQFLRENNLHSSLKELTRETGIHLDTVSDISELKNGIIAGKWDAVLKELADIDIPKRNLIDLYELIVVDLIKIGQVSAARAFLRKSEVTQLMRDSMPDRYLVLEGMLIGGSQEHPLSREHVADELAKVLKKVDRGRLVALIWQAVKWQISEELIDTNAGFNLYEGIVPVAKEEPDNPPCQIYKTINFSKASGCCCSVFSPDGKYLVTGTKGMLGSIN